MKHRQHHCRCFVLGDKQRMNKRRITGRNGFMGVTRRRLMELAGLAPLAIMPSAASAQERQFRHGATMFESLKYPAGFKHFDYVNPNAPKGGKLRLGVLGSFDSLNANTLKGDPIDPGVNETLMARALDEPSSEYGLLAESVWYPDDYSQVVYRLRPEAKFHDGERVKPEDVIFSFESTKANLPRVQGYYKDISKVEKTGDREITFTFSVKGNRELPQITGQISVLPMHWWTGKDAAGKQRDISAAGLEAPLGSGPYKLGKIVSGQSFTLVRVPDYWGATLPVNVGHNNFDEIEYQIYKDQTVLFEAFKGDQFDIQRESTAKNWATGYDFPAVKNGSVIKQNVPQEGVQGMQAWVMNLRREKFQDVRVRRALNLAFDFEWSRENLFYGQYTRSRSYFNNSELEAKGLPSVEELSILEPLKDKLPAEVFSTEYANPVNTTPQQRRKNLREAQVLLAEAGWKSQSSGNSRVLKNAKGDVFNLDFLLYSPAFERIALPYKEQLELIGFVVNIRTVDLSQYERRTEDFDYDIIVGSWGQSLSPGNEQRDFFGSDFADKKGSRNSSGVKDAAVDAIINQLIAAKDRKTLVAACRALDRALMWNHFVVPMWFVPGERLAYWKRVAHPEPLPGYALGYPAIWWFDEKAAAEIKKS
jgi:microcin C transport system substrate-binding protein